MKDQELKAFRDRFDIPVSDADIVDAPYYRPAESSPEIQYLLERRRALGGFVPSRRSFVGSLQVPDRKAFAEFHGGSERGVSTTMAFVQVLRSLLKDPEIGDRIVQRVKAQVAKPALREKAVVLCKAVNGVSTFDFVCFTVSRVCAEP